MRPRIAFARSWHIVRLAIPKSMNADQLKSLQAPLKAQYRERPETALVTLRAEGRIGENITCKINTGKTRVEAGLHPATGGDGQSACSADMLLEALVGCAGVTLRAVATALNIPLRSATIRAEGDLDFRGTLGVSKDVPVGFKEIRLNFDLDTDASEEQLATLLRLTERYCVVYQTLSLPAEHQRFASRNIAVKFLAMPLYMDIHNLPDGTTPEDVAKAHAKDVATQQKYGVEYTNTGSMKRQVKFFVSAMHQTLKQPSASIAKRTGWWRRSLLKYSPNLRTAFWAVSKRMRRERPVPGAGADARDPGIRTVLFTDIVNSTTLTQSLGDEAALAILGVHDTIVRDALSALGGREVKHTGDGIMASFVSAAGAVRCAIQIQRELDKHAQANPDRPLKVRVGAAAGEPVEQHNDLFDRLFNWPPACALTRSRNKSSYQT